jgi:hypothetical protein
MDTPTIEKFLEEIKHLQDAKLLLKVILSYYDIYTGIFDNEKIEDFEDKCRKNPGLFYKDSLNTKIRDYLKFDDSE